MGAILDGHVANQPEVLKNKQVTSRSLRNKFEAGHGFSALSGGISTIFVLTDGKDQYHSYLE